MVMFKFVELKNSIIFEIQIFWEKNIIWQQKQHITKSCPRIQFEAVKYIQLGK